MRQVVIPLKKRNYNIFTKAELVAFLNRYEENFMYCTSPFDIMAEIRMDSLLLEIDKVNQVGKRLIKEYEKTGNVENYLLAARKNSEKWEKLHEEYEQIEKIRFQELERSLKDENS